MQALLLLFHIILEKLPSICQQHIENYSQHLNKIKQLNLDFKIRDRYRKYSHKVI